MLRLFTILLSLLCSIISAFAESSKSENIIKIGVYDDPPMVFIENGVIKGIYPEVFEAVALKKGIKFEYVSGSWSEIYNGVIDGRLDMVFDIAKTKEREAFLDFNNETIITAWGVIMSRKGVKISSMADLIDKKISAVADDVYYEGHPDSFKEMMEIFGYRCQFIEFGGFTEAANAVINGKADACVLAKSYADYQLKGSNLEKTPIIFKPIKLHFGFTKGSSAGANLIPDIDRAISAMKSDKNSEYYKIFDSYLNDFTVIESIPKWIVFTVSGSFAIIVVFFAFFHIYSLRKNVREKTSELKEMNRLLTDLSNNDPLTGVANRRVFNERMEYEIQRAQRYGSALALILFDLDRFKEINDRFGHIAGDSVLVHIAQRLSLNTRTVDLVSRYGGEEFSIILPETSLENAASIAEKIRSVICSHSHSINGFEVRVSLTGGVAIWSDEFRGMSDFVNAADAALYKGKRSGRNKIEIYQQSRVLGIHS